MVCYYYYSFMVICSRYGYWLCLRVASLLSLVRLEELLPVEPLPRLWRWRRGPLGSLAPNSLARRSSCSELAGSAPKLCGIWPSWGVVAPKESATAPFPYGRPKALPPRPLPMFKGLVAVFLYPPWWPGAKTTWAGVSTFWTPPCDPVSGAWPWSVFFLENFLITMAPLTFGLRSTPLPELMLICSTKFDLL